MSHLSFLNNHYRVEIMKLLSAFLQFFVISYLLGPNILLSTLFSNTGYSEKH